MNTLPERTTPLDLTFETARLRARALGDADADEELYTKLYCDPRVMRFVATPFTPEQAGQTFRSALENHGRTGAVLTISERSTGRPIGICAVHRIDWGRRLTEAGIMLLPEYQARGYGQEGLSALFTRVFTRLPIDEVRVRIAEAHSRVRRTVVGIGLTRRTDLEPVDGSPGLQVWSTNRHSWSTTTITNEGEADDGTHRCP